MLAGQISTDELYALADSSAVEKLNYEQIVEECKSDLQMILNQHNLSDFDIASLPISDPLIKLIEVLAYREMLLKQRVNESVQSCSLLSPKTDDLTKIAKAMTGKWSQDDKEQIAKDILQQYQEYHTAGSVQAYIYHVKKAINKLSSEETKDRRVIADVSVVNIEEASVRVTVLFEPEISGIERSELIAEIHRYIADEEIRPIGHRLEVQEAYVKHFNVIAEIGLDDSPGANEVLDKAREDVRSYVEQQYRLGQNIYRSALLSALYQPGIRYIILHNLTDYEGSGDLNVEEHQAAYCDLERIDVRIHTGLPTEMISAAWIEQIYKIKDMISFKLLITPPAHEVRLSAYTLYWSDKSGRKLPTHLPISDLPAGGAHSTMISNIVIPESAAGIVIHTANQNGEMEQGFFVSLPRTVIDDA